MAATNARAAGLKSDSLRYTRWNRRVTLNRRKGTSTSLPASISWAAGPVSNFICTDPALPANDLKLHLAMIEEDLLDKIDLIDEGFETFDSEEKNEMYFDQRGLYIPNKFNCFYWLGLTEKALKADIKNDIRGVSESKVLECEFLEMESFAYIELFTDEEFGLAADYYMDIMETSRKAGLKQNGNDEDLLSPELGGDIYCLANELKMGSLELSE